MYSSQGVYTQLSQFSQAQPTIKPMVYPIDTNEVSNNAVTNYLSSKTANNCPINIPTFPAVISDNQLNDNNAYENNDADYFNVAPMASVQMPTTITTQVPTTMTTQMPTTMTTQMQNIPIGMSTQMYASAHPM